MRSPEVVVLVFLIAALSGCVAEDTPAPTDDLAGKPTKTIYEDEDISVQDLEIIDWEPTLEEAPPWRVGEWWLVEMTDAFTGSTTRFYRVVAGFDNASNSYLVGMPTHGFSNTIMVLHIPGFGQINKDTLGFELHDHMMDPLKFPLEDGLEWETMFETSAITVNAQVISDTEAKFVFTGGRSGEYIYDAKLHAIREFQVNNYGTYKVVEHGFDFHEIPGWGGNVTVPYEHDLIFQHGCIAGVSATPAKFRSAPFDSTPAAPCQPIETQIVPEGYDRVSFATIVGDVVGVLTQGFTGGTDGPAAAQEEAVAPDGEIFSHTFAGVGLETISYKSDSPVGEWTFRHLAGNGIALSEGIAYKVFDIHLPVGEIIETAGEHEHDDPSAGHV